jgi:uncharacterized protein
MKPWVTIGRAPFVAAAVAVSVLATAGARTPVPPEDAATAAYDRHDFATAFALIRPVAEAGNPRGEVDLAGLYFRGRGTPKDERAAFRWFKRAADQGFAPGQYFLSVCYAVGAGTPRDLLLADRLLHASAEQGYLPAEFALGIPSTLLGGISIDIPGVPEPDPAESEKWMHKAADSGFAEAQAALAANLGLNAASAADQAEAVRWARKAADQGNAQGELILASHYQSGLGVSKDANEAARWYLKAAVLGAALAQQNLAYLYAEGRGVPKDVVQAHMWIDLAERQFGESPFGDWTRQSNLSLIDSMGGPATPDQLKEAGRLADDWLASHPPQPPADRAPMWLTPTS